MRKMRDAEAAQIATGEVEEEYVAKPKGARPCAALEPERARLDGRARRDRRGASRPPGRLRHRRRGRRALRGRAPRLSPPDGAGMARRVPCLYAFDLLHLGREDLRPLELANRRGILKKLVRKGGPSRFANVAMSPLYPGCGAGSFFHGRQWAAVMMTRSRPRSTTKPRPSPTRTTARVSSLSFVLMLPAHQRAGRCPSRRSSACLASSPPAYCSLPFGSKHATTSSRAHPLDAGSECCQR
jgi:hypothetical protein